MTLFEEKNEMKNGLLHMHAKWCLWWFVAFLWLILGVITLFVGHVTWLIVTSFGVANILVQVIQKWWRNEFRIEFCGSKPELAFYFLKNLMLGVTCEGGIMRQEQPLFKYFLLGKICMEILVIVFLNCSADPGDVLGNWWN